MLQLTLKITLRFGSISIAYSFSYRLLSFLDLSGCTLHLLEACFAPDCLPGVLPWHDGFSTMFIALKNKTYVMQYYINL